MFFCFFFLRAKNCIYWFEFKKAETKVNDFIIFKNWLNNVFVNNSYIVTIEWFSLWHFISFHFVEVEHKKKILQQFMMAFKQLWQIKNYCKTVMYNRKFVLIHFLFFIFQTKKSWQKCDRFQKNVFWKLWNLFFDIIIVRAGYKSNACDGNNAIITKQLHCIAINRIKFDGESVKILILFFIIL